MRPSLPVSASNIQHTATHDFGAEIEGAGVRLLVPQNVAEALERLAIQTAEEFVSYVYSFPSAIAGELGWEPEDVIRARPNLLARLRGFVPDDILDPKSPPRHSYGTFHPSGIARPGERRGAKEGAKSCQ